MRPFRFPSPVVRVSVAGLVVVAALALAAAALAQSAGPYDLNWNTFDGGGGTSAAGQFTLSGSAGQPDAGAMSGGHFTLGGGFWAGVWRAHQIYLPLIVRNTP